MCNDAISVHIDSLIGEVVKIKIEGYRFVTMSCAALDENNVDILYHFDKDLRLKHLRLTITRDTAVPSISAVYFAAFLIENEMQDLFDLRFEGLVIDYERRLYLDEEVHTTPFCKYTFNQSRKKDSQSPPATDAVHEMEEH